MIYPIILSGGSGTRLWPLSREHYPKQLLPLLSDKTLLQEATTRADGIADLAAPLFVCNEEHRFLVAEQAREVDKVPLGIVLEPSGRNTAPALTLAALTVTDQDDDAVLLVMPADHHIPAADAFRASVELAIPLAGEGRLVTFGITPTTPETGYGYIKCGKPIGTESTKTPHGSPLTPHEIAAFIEKPDTDTARRYLHAGDYLWNSGMFMMRPDVWLEELNRFQPEIIEACKKAYAKGEKDGDFCRVHKESFLSCPNNSIDYAVMEKTSKAVVMPLDAGWSDVGSWSSFWDASPRDNQNNVILGDVHVHDTKNTLVISKHRLVATVGLNDMVVVETPDAVLVAHKDKAQDVKAIVDWLKSQERDEHKTHRRVYRPWGHYEGVDAGARFQVKRLTVYPGASLSLQLHHHRAEHWVVVKGTAKVTRGDEVFTLTENQSTYIRVETKHRLENPSTAPLEVIEVQSGDYLGEDDIVRFEDKYKRT
ncbi:MAG: mannose-1-phosphate guanylyltransferase/mannose-6-phosphate isomerase [Gammaproteobacteria bacterium]|nr:mannose-1-phosphate guanylyltransferase/mannose-6-phosphate isomerase [Gammaproteobacteria bacterium]